MKTAFVIFTSLSIGAADGRFLIVIFVMPSFPGAFLFLSCLMILVISSIVARFGSSIFKLLWSLQICWSTLCSMFSFDRWFPLSCFLEESANTSTLSYLIFVGFCMHFVVLLLSTARDDFCHLPELIISLVSFCIAGYGVRLVAF